MPLISVIIPVYNGEKTIKETIESVLNQTFSDFELIVINDGSQDSTLEILDSIQDSRLQVFSYPNANQAVSRNRGIYHASGEYISFIDADDLWTPDKLEAQLQALQENPQADVAYSWTNYIDEAGNFLRRIGHVKLNGNVYANLLIADFIGSGSNPLIRSRVLREIGGFEQSLTPHEDRDMWLRLAQFYQFVVVPSPQVLYRQSANSASANVWQMEASSLQVIERAFNQAPESLKNLKRCSLANLYKGLTSKVLEGNPTRKRGIAAARFLGQAVRNDLSLLFKPVMAKLLFKIATFLLLPSATAKKLLTTVTKLSDTTTLLGYIQVDPFSVQD